VASSSRSEPVERVGFIGLGDMGGAMARRIIETGWATVLWARRPDVVAAYAAANVEVASSPAALAAGADVVGICVWGDEDVREVLTRADGVLAGCRPGTVVAVHSTVTPATCRDLAEVAAAHGIALLDAPVTGGHEVALSGALTVAVGGDESALARCRPIFESFADTILRMGDVGSGQVAKLLNNALLAANLAVADDAITLGAELGVDAAVLTEFLREGSGRSYALDVALLTRASEEKRRAAAPPLDKDLRTLNAEAAALDRVGSFLRDAAADAITRLRHPPPGWQ
jgi:3-hydroxyisobutyrate dehydrogenase-like beta-hydroxyacid dehydrogenase